MSTLGRRKKRRAASLPTRTWVLFGVIGAGVLFLIMLMLNGPA